MGFCWKGYFHENFRDILVIAFCSGVTKVLVIFYLTTILKSLALLFFHTIFLDRGKMADSNEIQTDANKRRRNYDQNIFSFIQLECQARLTLIRIDTYEPPGLVEMHHVGPVHLSHSLTSFYSVIHVSIRDVVPRGANTRRVSEKDYFGAFVNFGDRPWRVATPRVFYKFLCEK